MRCGIDEAGRGPVIGPLVVAAYAAPDPQVLVDLGCRDSKRLAPARREFLERRLRALPGARFHIVVIPPDEIDEAVGTIGLNALELRAFAEAAAAAGAGPDLPVIADAADVDAARFGRNLAASLPAGTLVVAEHKADDTHVEVAAASILAKVERDRQVATLARRLERRLDRSLGSGYPGDATTVAFLAAWYARFGDLPDGVRRSWKTARRYLAPQATRLDAFGAGDAGPRREGGGGSGANTSAAAKDATADHQNG